MFQRLLDDDCRGDFQREGDFVLEANGDLTNYFNEKLFEGTLLADMVHIVDYWFKKPPEKIDEVIRINDTKEGVEALRLSNIRIAGSW